MIKKHTITIEYFKWQDIEKELMKQFSEDEVQDYRREHFDSDFMKDGMFVLNLYFYGPRKKDCDADPEEAKRAKTIFKQHKFTEKQKAVMKVCHALWDLLESETEDIENIHVQP